MKRLVRLFIIWRAGKIGYAKRAKWFNEYSRWYFSYYGEKPNSSDEVKKFFVERILGFQGYTYDDYLKSLK